MAAAVLEPSAITAYYRSPAIRARIADYCGGRRADSFSCFQLAGYGGVNRRAEVDGGPTPVSNGELERLFEEGADVCRSLADLGGTLLQLDVDYVNPDDPAEPYHQAGAVFARLAPVHQAVMDLFQVYGMEPLVILTGRGYHFTVRAPLGSPFQSSLAALAEPPAAPTGRPAPKGVDPTLAGILARGHEGAGRILEHIVHRVAHRLRGRTDVPVVLAEMPPPEGGPFVCLDLTAHGDPLFERHCRCPFSTNQKASLQGMAPERPFVFTLPCNGQPLARLLSWREDAHAASAWAAAAQTTIPDVSNARGLVDDYRRGPVGRFHAEFYGGPRMMPSQWPFTYDRLTEDPLPACLRAPLENPNPLLLRPACLRTVALGLWGMGWHPRSIAALVESRYEKDHGWVPSFTRYDAASRAQFYVRTICGALADGLDSGAAFTCETQRARGLCEGVDRCSEDERRLFASAALALHAKEKR